MERNNLWLNVIRYSLLENYTEILGYFLTHLKEFDMPEKVGE